MSAVFLDFGSATRGDMDCTKLEQAISPWCFYEESSEQQVLERIKDVEVVVSNKGHAKAKLEKTPHYMCKPKAARILIGFRCGGINDQNPPS